MELEEDENMILDDKGCFEGNKKIILTSKRIVLFKKKELFGDYNILEREIPLIDIYECTLEKSSLEENKIKIQLKNGEKHFLVFPAKLSALAFGSIYDFDQTKSAITDKWVLAINQQIHKKVQEPLKLLQVRFIRGEISTAEYEKMKKVIEKKRKKDRKNLKKRVIALEKKLASKDKN